ncbi:MAG: hypothetical protein OSB41_04995 [Kiritimatiellae bacterium]|nr:hypothetical protein [Kiritimatiellia bacterium]
MKILKKTFFSVFLSAFVGFVLWQVFVFREDPDVLYRAIPDETLFLSEHADLAERWTEILDSPAIVSAAEAFGVEAKDIRELTENEVTQMILDRFASERVLVGYSPSLRRGGAPGWVLASWVGTDGQLLRWGLYEGILDDFERVRFRNGRSGWIMRDVEFSGQMHSLTVAVSEGVLLGCLSTDEEGVQHLVQRLERSTSHSPAVRALVEDGFDPETTPDRGWVRFWPTHSPVGSPRGWHFGARFDEKGRMAGSIRGPILPALHEQSPWDLVNTFSSSHEEHLPPGVQQLNDVLGAAPSVLAVMPYAYSAASLSLLGKDTRAVIDVLSDHVDEEALMFMSLTTRDYWGKLLDFDIPALLLGLKLTQEMQSEALVNDVLDSLNARHGWGLIRRVASVDEETPVIRIDSGTQPAFTRGLKGLAPCYAVLDGWLIFSTSQTGLETLVARYNNFVPGLAPMRWSEEMTQVPGDVLVWADLDSAASTTRKMIGIYDLWVRWQNKPRNSSLRQNLGLIDAVMLRVQEMQSLCLWSDLDETRCEFKFLLGGKQQDDAQSSVAL